MSHKNVRNVKANPKNKEDPARGDERGLQVSAEALTRPARPGRRRGRKLSRSLSVARRGRTNAGSERLPCIFCKLAAKPRRHCRWKKKGPIRRWGLKDRGKAQIESVADGRGRRKRHLPVDLAPGRRRGVRSGCRSRDPREEDTGRVTSTRLYMLIFGPFSNVANYMSAMRLMQ